MNEPAARARACQLAMVASACGGSDQPLPVRTMRPNLAGRDIDSPRFIALGD